MLRCECTTAERTSLSRPQAGMESVFAIQPFLTLAPPKIALTEAQLTLRHMVLDSATSVHSHRDDARALLMTCSLAAGRPLSRAPLMRSGLA